MMRTYDSVCPIITAVIDKTVHIHTLHSFVGQYPQETTGTTGMLTHHFPVIVQSGAMSAIVQSVQEFCRHKDFRFTHIVLTFAIRTVMHGFKPAEVALRMQYGTKLRVVFMEFTVQLIVPAFFITIAPPDNTRVIDITFYHFFHQLLSDNSFMLAVPAGKFVHQIKAQ